MKTRRFISKLRAVAEFTALSVVVLLFILLFTHGDFLVQETVLQFWPIGSGILLAYAVLMFAEDYLNHRILNNLPKLS